MFVLVSALSSAHDGVLIARSVANAAALPASGSILLCKQRKWTLLRIASCRLVRANAKNEQLCFLCVCLPWLSGVVF